MQLFQALETCCLRSPDPLESSSQIVQDKIIRGSVEFRIVEPDGRDFRALVRMLDDLDSGSERPRQPAIASRPLSEGRTAALLVEIAGDTLGPMDRAEFQ